VAGWVLGLAVVGGLVVIIANTADVASSSGPSTAAYAIKLTLGCCSCSWRSGSGAAGKATSDVLFSGQNALYPLITNAASYSVGALVLLMVCKGLAYGVSLSSFRGGPIFPAMFIGAGGASPCLTCPGYR
jgi:hypothetical protein